MTLGAFSGASIALKGNLGLIYFDAHGDLNTDKTTLTGNIHGIQQPLDKIWVSLDLDAIDSMYAPGVGMPNSGGLLYREIAILAEYIGQHCNVVGVDVVEYSPLRDIEQKTAELGIELITKFFGSNYSWYTNYLKKNKLT